MASVSTTFWAAGGAEVVDVDLAPCLAAGRDVRRPGSHSLVTRRSAYCTTAVLIVTPLLLSVPSGCSEADRGGVADIRGRRRDGRQEAGWDPTWIWKSSMSPSSIVPSEHVSVPGIGCVHGTELLRKVTPAGRTSVTTAFMTLPGPLLTTVTVYSSVWPAVTGSGSSLLKIWRSATGRPKLTSMLAWHPLRKDTRTPDGVAS